MHDKTYDNMCDCGARLEFLGHGTFICNYCSNRVRKVVPWQSDNKPMPMTNPSDGTKGGIWVKCCDGFVHGVFFGVANRVLLDFVIPQIGPGSGGDEHLSDEVDLADGILDDFELPDFF